MSDPTTVTQTGIKDDNVAASSVIDEEVSFEIAAYPNPVDGILNVSVRGIEEVDAALYIMDLSGKLISIQEMKTTAVTVDMSSYASGTYMIRYKDVQGRTGSLKITRK
ncbi:MAG: T9SS type A sorting domain-containing protein [Chitinophagaceae bacterium]|nr:MAG: T9SS type A sorting domain-containing protein [Chitinophagaceae bacterium]